MGQVRATLRVRDDADAGFFQDEFAPFRFSFVKDGPRSYVDAYVTTLPTQQLCPGFSGEVILDTYDADALSGLVSGTQIDVGVEADDDVGSGNLVGPLFESIDNPTPNELRLWALYDLNEPAVDFDLLLISHANLHEVIVELANDPDNPTADYFLGLIEQGNLR